MIDPKSQLFTMNRKIYKNTYTFHSLICDYFELNLLLIYSCIDLWIYLFYSKHKSIPGDFPPLGLRPGSMNKRTTGRLTGEKSCKLITF